MTLPFWIRIKARPEFCGPVSVGTVEPIKVLRDALNLTLAEAKSVIDKAVFDGEVARVLTGSEREARTVARQLADAAPGILCTWAEPQQRVDNLILVIPDKVDSERDAVADAWELAGGSVERLARFWEPPPIPRERVRLYGPDTFALVVAQKLGIDVAEPDPYAVFKCPARLLGRAVSVERLGAAAGLNYPCFLKPVVPKQFRAGVFETYAELQAETRGLDDATELLRSEVVTIVAEARSFVLDGVVQSCALYEGTGNVDTAAKTCERVAMALELPRASVLDVGLLEGGDWVFIEANAAWGAGLNGCDPHRVLACIAAASSVR
jgi:ATP-grasp domain, R2K clade family 2